MSDGPGSRAIVTRPAAFTVDVLAQDETARAAMLLFRGHFDTVQIAALFHCSEPDVVALLDRSRGRSIEQAAP